MKDYPQVSIYSIIDGPHGTCVFNGETLFSFRNTFFIFCFFSLLICEQCICPYLVLPYYGKGLLAEKDCMLCLFHHPEQF